MIDQASRNKLFEDNKTKLLVNGMKDSIKAMIDANHKDSTQNKEVLELVVDRKEDNRLIDMVEKITKAIPILYKAMPRSVTLPRIFPIQGKVEVTRMPSVRITNINELEKYFHSLENNLRLWAQAASTAQPPQVNIPKIEIPKADNKAIIEAIQNLKIQVPKGDSKDIIDGLYKIQVAIGELVDKPTFVPPTVTNVNINSLKGVALSTPVSVTGTATLLPAAPLVNRRSLIVYNNSAQTLYIGGASVSTSNGLPIAAGTYSPSIDAGILMKVYGIVSGGSADVRVLEISNEASGN